MCEVITSECECERVCMWDSKEKQSTGQKFDKIKRRLRRRIGSPTGLSNGTVKHGNGIFSLRVVRFRPLSAPVVRC